MAVPTNQPLLSFLLCVGTTKGMFSYGFLILMLGVIISTHTWRMKYHCIRLLPRIRHRSVPFLIRTKHLETRTENFSKAVINEIIPHCHHHNIDLFEWFFRYIVQYVSRLILMLWISTTNGSTTFSIAYVDEECIRKIGATIANGSWPVPIQSNYLRETVIHFDTNLHPKTKIFTWSSDGRSPLLLDRTHAARMLFRLSV